MIRKFWCGALAAGPDQTRSRGRRPDLPSPMGGFPIASSVSISQGGGFNGTDWPQGMGGTIRYSLSFEVQAVPEPGPASLLLAGALGLLGWHRVGGRRVRR